MLPHSFTLLPLLAAAVGAQKAGDITHIGSTLVSAMMMFLGSPDKLYILDKAEGNPVNISGHPAWGAVWDLKTNQATLVDVYSNTFCASGSHLPNGSWVAFGGNNAVTPGPNDYHGPGVAPVYQDFDGRQSIRVINSCTGTVSSWPDSCQWYDNPANLHMLARRWYSTAEALGDGTVVLIGGMVNGGYINRNNINPTDPVTQKNQAENTYELYPAPAGFTKQVVNFLVDAGGLNTYAHAFLMPSGKMFLQANVSTTLWDVASNTETPLPDMPGGWVRVYPASAATAMLPLTPQNNYTPTIIFCGGGKFTNAQWGTYGGPGDNMWEFPAATDCQRITPEPSDGSQAAYVEDDPLPVGRTMGQFIILPNGKLLCINGAAFGTAGYTTGTPQIPITADLPYSLSLATGPVYQPVIYDPEAPAGSRFSSAGLQNSTIPRMYHSSAMLLPDGSVFVAGSNPNADYNATAYYPSEARAEIFYPPYWGKSRPKFSGAPTTLTYGGAYFNLTVAAGSFSGKANAAASNTTVVITRGGFTTHAMNMGQRFLQLNNTFTVNSNGSITLHVSQPPPNANLFTPGPALLWVVVNGLPSNASWLSIGTGDFGTQPTSPQDPLPISAFSESGGSTGSDGSTGLSTGAVIALAAGGVVALLAVGGLIWYFLKRRNASGGSGGMGMSASGRISGPYDAMDEPLRGAGRQAYSDNAYPPSPNPGMKNLGASLNTGSNAAFMQDQGQQGYGGQGGYGQGGGGYGQQGGGYGQGGYGQQGGGYGQGGGGYEQRGPFRGQNQSEQSIRGSFQDDERAPTPYRGNYDLRGDAGYGQQQPMAGGGAEYEPYEMARRR